MKIAKIKNPVVLRFASVGVFNTGVDFLLLVTLSTLGVPVILANYFSTTTAFIVSFFLNRTFTFRSADKNINRQLILFILVTTTGIWVIQPVIIVAVQSITPSGTIWLMYVKLLATLASLSWNYLLYSRFVFKK